MNYLSSYKRRIQAPIRFGFALVSKISVTNLISIDPHYLCQNRSTNMPVKADQKQLQNYTICRDIPLTLARACIIFVVCTAYTTLWRHDLPWMLQWNSWFCHFFPHPNCYQKKLLISQSLVCLCYPYVYDQATYGINHTELCCVCRCLWSRGFSKIPHSLRSCGIFKKPLDHKCLHTSIVQYCLLPSYSFINTYGI